MPADFNIVVGAGLLIGLAYGVVGLLSGFCLLSGLRGWWAEGDSRLIRTFALALAVAVVATQLLADTARSISANRFIFSRHFRRR